MVSHSDQLNNFFPQTIDFFINMHAIEYLLYGCSEPIKQTIILPCGFLETIKQSLIVNKDN